MGINPECFNWRLEAGESFTTPEAVMVYSNNGIGGMSRIYHRLYRNNLCRGKWKHKRRPILVNNPPCFKFFEVLKLSYKKVSSGVRGKPREKQKSAEIKIFLDTHMSCVY